MFQNVQRFMVLEKGKAMTNWFCGIAFYVICSNFFYKYCLKLTNPGNDEFGLANNIFQYLKGLCAVFAITVCVGYQLASLIFYLSHNKFLSKVMYDSTQGYKTSYVMYCVLDNLIHIGFCLSLYYKWCNHISMLSCITAFLITRYWSYLNSGGNSFYHFANDIYFIPSATSKYVWYAAYFGETICIIGHIYYSS